MMMHRGGTKVIQGQHSVRASNTLNRPLMIARSIAQIARKNRAQSKNRLKGFFNCAAPLGWRCTIARRLRKKTP